MADEIDEQFSRLTVVVLKKRLAKLKCSVVGNKAELCERLKAAVFNTEDDDDILEDAEDDRESVYHESMNGAVGGYDKAKPVFSFKDVDESFETFSGDDNKDIKKWLDDFEDMSELMRWNDLQKIVFSNRLLKGSAKLFMKSEGIVREWHVMRQKLTKEFGVTVNSAIIHKQLRERCKKPNETYRQYLYCIMDMAKQAAVEEDAVISYVIDGIKDTEGNKAVLYAAKTVVELKEQLKTYERMKSKDVFKGIGTINKSTVPTSTSTSTGPNDKTVSTRKCFGCNKTGHDKKDCPEKKCFKCNKTGHMAFQCVVESIKPAVNSLSYQKLMKEVTIAGKKIIAMCDTGSDVTCIRWSDYLSLGLTSDLSENVGCVTGIGKSKVKVMGKFRENILIDEEVYSDNILVLSNEATEVPMIIGLTLMNQAFINIDSSINKVVFIKRSSCGTPTSGTIANIVNSSEDIGECDIVNQLMTIDLSENEQEVKSDGQRSIENMIGKYCPAKSVDTPIKTKIVLLNDNPIFQRPRRLAPKEKEVVSAQIDEWLREGVIRESCSVYASPVVVVKKKNGSHRLCIDYRRLNKEILRDHFPMPIIEDQIDKLAGARVFTVLDLKNGFFHVPMDDSSIKYTAFVTYDGQYEFLKTPFGLSVSPSSFLRYVHHVFKDLIRKGVVITYMDDLIIPSTDEDEGVQKFKQVLQVAERAGMDINWSKCKFLERKVVFLGFEVCDGNMKPSPETVSGVNKFPEPKNAEEVQRFLGLCGYFRKFVEGFALIAKPLSELLKKDKCFHFAEKARVAWKYLKNVLCNEPVLQIYDIKAETELHTDASQEGYGAILMQKSNKDGQFHPVYYLCKQTTDAEKKYHSYELEMLAIVYAFRKLRVYLLGLHVKVITDCSAVTNAMNKSDIVPRIARWVMQLQDFDFDIQHRSGTRMRHVDALSRIVMVINKEVSNGLRECQAKDEHLTVIMKILEKQSYEDYSVQGGVLMKTVNGKTVVVVPEQMQMDIMRKVHDNGHFGVVKMTEVIEQDYFIPRLREKLERLMENCINCILAERKKGKREGYLRPIPKENAPLLTYHLDHLGPMHMTCKMYKYLFVVVDAFTKYSWIYPTKTTNAQEVLNCLERQQKTFGNPRRIIADKGGAFTSNLVSEYCENEGIELITITTGVPRGNGQVERVNQVLIPLLTKLSGSNPEKWYQHVDRVQRCLNSTYHRSVSITPFEVLLGVKMRQKEDLHILNLLEEELVEKFGNEREELRVEAMKNINRCQNEQRRYYNRKCKPARKYKENDVVAIERTQFAPGLKLKGKYLGPYKVVQDIGADRYQLRKIGTGEGAGETSSSADHMKPWRNSSLETNE